MPLPESGNTLQKISLSSQRANMLSTLSSGQTVHGFTDDILLLQKPAVFRGMIDEWEVMKWGLEDWVAVFGDSPMPFRSGAVGCSPCPLWEANSSTEEMTMKQFFDLPQQSTSELKKGDKWYYFDYKHVGEWLPGDKLKSVSWRKFGFPERDAQDSTLWIGSGGAHTPCHYDTYGVNLVAQIFGSKQWLLFPPNESKNMKPTRVPYEESSVYSQLNFNCPLPSSFYLGLGEVFVVDLKPGDVLFVPQHWWHYVESLELSISINMWERTKLDAITHLDESLVRFFMSQVSKQLTENEGTEVLNPNEIYIQTISMCDTLQLMNQLFEEYINQAENEVDKNKREAEVVEPPSKCSKLEDLNECKLLLMLRNNLEFVSSCSHDTLKNILEGKCKCCSEEGHKTSIKTSLSNKQQNLYLTRVLNAFCHPEIIMKVRENILENYSS